MRKTIAKILTLVQHRSKPLISYVERCPRCFCIAFPYIYSVHIDKSQWHMVHLWARVSSVYLPIAYILFVQPEKSLKRRASKWGG